MTKPFPVLLLSTLCASAVAVAAAWWWSSPRAEAPRPPVADQQLDGLLARLDRIEQQLAQRQAGEPVFRSAADTPSRAEIEGWIADAVAAQSVGSAVPAAGGVAANDDFGVDAALARLLEFGSMEGEDAQAIWARAREAGKVGALIEAFEANATQNPRSADAQAQLGDAYVPGIVAASDMIEQSTYGTKADKAYDAALALDETHWHARFSKATGLTFWPDFLGKKPEAIRHFEVLCAQQESSPRRPEHLQTWLVLGNLYAQQGKDDDARRTWARGLAQFPDDPQLREKLGR